MDKYIYNLYLALLKKNNLPIRKFENELRKQLGIKDNSIKVIKSEYNKKIIEILNKNKNKNSLSLYHSKKQCLWIAKFMRNFEQCYELSEYQRFYYDDRSESASIEKIRKIIERYNSRGEMNRIYRQLNEIGIYYSEESKTFELK